MNTLILVTHKDDEIEKLIGKTSTRQDENMLHIMTNNDDMQLIVIDSTWYDYYEKKWEDTALAEPLKHCNTIKNPKILLFHGPIEGYQGECKFDVGTGGYNNDSPDRNEYKKLLEANNKFTVFGEVWHYFSGEYAKEKLELDKIDFLYHIYNGEKPETFGGLYEIIELTELEHLYREFNNTPYQKTLDFAQDETKGKDQRTDLSLLRDALLTEK